MHDIIMQFEVNVTTWWQMLADCTQLLRRNTISFDFGSFSGYYSYQGNPEPRTPEETTALKS